MSAKLGEHLLRTRPLAGAELVRRTPQRLVKTGPVCVVKAFALVCRDELHLRPFRQVDGLVEQEPSAPHPSLERQRHTISLGLPRAGCNRTVLRAEASRPQDPSLKPAPMPLPRAMMLATLIHARASSSVMSTYWKMPSPRPPYSGVIRSPKYLQETYHTRILADVVAIFGLPVFARPPRLLARTLVKLLVAAPEDSLLPLTGFGEMAGCTIFRALRDRGVELFAAEPAVAARIRLLYDEILADELCHVGFIAALLGPTARALMRGLYWLVALALAGQMARDGAALRPRRAATALP